MYVWAPRRWATGHQHSVLNSVATLLAQLKNDRQGRSAGPLQTSLGYLTDTLRPCTSFRDLQGYQKLLSPGSNRMQGETDQMRKLEERDDLKPFLPKPTQ